METTPIRKQIYEFIELYVDTPEPKKLCSSIEDLVEELNIIKMETVITTTKTELIEAMHAYHLDFLNNPNDFEDVTDSKEDAVEKAEMLIEYLIKLKK